MYLFLNIILILYGLMESSQSSFFSYSFLFLMSCSTCLKPFSYLVGFFPLNFRNALLTILVHSFIFTWLYVSWCVFFLYLLCNTCQKFCIHLMDVICVCVYRVLAFGVNVSLKHTLYIILLYCFEISLLHNIPFKVW